MKYLLTLFLLFLVGPVHADPPSLPVTQYLPYVYPNGRPALVITPTNLTRPLTDAEVALITAYNLSLDVQLGAPLILLGYPSPTLPGM